MDLAQLPSCRYGNCSYEPSGLSSEIFNFALGSQSLTVNQELPTTSPRIDNKQGLGEGHASLFTNTTLLWNNVSNNNDNSPVGGSFSGVLMPHINVNPGYFRYHEAQSSLVNTNQSNEIPGGQYSQKHFEDVQFSSSSLYQNSIQEVETRDSVEMASLTDRGPWVDSRSELHLLPAYGDRWHDGADIPKTQALSLSLSSVSPSSKQHLGQAGDLHCNMLLAPNPPRSVMPFGPFTGYATILKSSRFLKPAQHLLDELCNSSGHMALRIPELTEKILDEVNRCTDSIVNAATSLGGGGVGSSRSEFQQTRVMLLHMQNEVCRKYSQYRQQMQMVVSSFESVAGLSSATPYIVLALKTISSNFESLNNAISNQLRNTWQTSGEDLLSPTGKSKGDRVSSSLNLVDHGLEKQKAMGFLDAQPHVWRPQRGLPERAVSVLRAWLFDHFLHPYPTDSDKHMLANQTGLSRNQVSNWFINARVRVWKPMVEEIHMLETKAMAEKGSNVGKAEVTSASESAIQPNHFKVVNARGIPGIQAESCSGIGHAPYVGEKSQPFNWNCQEKQARINCHLPAGMGGPLMGFMPYQTHNNMERGGLGSVSLTLGLRQSADGVQQKQLQQHEPQLRQQLGGQMMIHDYFG